MTGQLKNLRQIALTQLRPLGVREVVVGVSADNEGGDVTVSCRMTDQGPQWATERFTDEATPWHLKRLVESCCCQIADELRG